MILDKTPENNKIVADVIREMANHPGYGPRWQPKLQDAAALVWDGAVDLDACTVHSGAHAYEIDARYGCTCADARLRNERYCKHFVAIEMAKRIYIQRENDMSPRKANPQESWEAQTQNHILDTPEVNDLFGDRPPEPDDIPEPKTRQENVEHNLDERQETQQSPMPEPEPVVYMQAPREIVHQGHQYTDYPVTLCVKRLVGHTEVMCTFRGENQDLVWHEAAAMIRKLDGAAKQYEQPAPTPAPAQATHAPTAAGDVPICPVHQALMKPSKYKDGEWYCTHKMQDGSYCKTKV